MKKYLLFLGVAVFLVFTASPIFADNSTTPDPITVASIQVFPGMAFTRYAGEVQFSARAYDMTGNWIKDMDLTGCWSTSAGMIDDFGRYIANVVGYHTVTCTYTEVIDGKNGQSIRTVEGIATVDVGEERPF